MNLSNKSLTDDTLGELVTETPSRCILLIEDVDAAFIQRTKGEGTITNNITFSGLSLILYRNHIVYFNKRKEKR